MITYYKYTGVDAEPWKFDKVNFSSINLLVGASGTGKTRFLNTLFNFSDFVSKGKQIRTGKWKIVIEAGGNEYLWKYEAGAVNSENVIKSESLIRKNGAKEEKIIQRGEKEFYFLNQKLPKLDSKVSSITLLKEEEVIKPVHKIFTHVQRRVFHENVLQEALSFESIPNAVLDHFKDSRNLEKLWNQSLKVSSRLYIFEQAFPELYTLATQFFKQIFPSVLETKVDIFKDDLIPAGDARVPVLLVKERGVRDWIPLQGLSSGMQKVMLIVTDILTLPGESVYIIDEYENSLGINAIDFLPQFLIDNGRNNQFIITTHHPYLINSMPIKNWLVFNRKGSTVRIKPGSEFSEKFGNSKQKAFIQLLNDPFYSKGAR
ncbi:MAG: ATP-binding protein [Calditrichaeota bacterium]|nr:MAG: ATP-binding protein [Calditrichota bacterium]